MSLGTRLYAAMVRLYPRRFRERYEPELLETFAIVAFSIPLVGCAAAAVPAWRATTADPLLALKEV